MYFLGVERKEPARRRDDLKRNIAAAQGTPSPATPGSASASRPSTRGSSPTSGSGCGSTREKEEGTYRRDVFKARLRAQQRRPAGAKGTEGIRATRRRRTSTSATSATRRRRPAPVAAARPGRPAPAAARRPLRRRPRPGPPSGPPAARSRRRPGPRRASASTPAARALYDAYVAARKSCNQDVAGITPEAHRPDHRPSRRRRSLQEPQGQAGSSSRSRSRTARPS